MEYRLGNSDRIHHHGKTAPIVCPNCNKKVNFSVFTNVDVRLEIKFPPIKSENVYFLICPECASVYGVDKSLGHNFRKGEKLSIGNYDLKELKKFEL